MQFNEAFNDYTKTQCYCFIIYHTVNENTGPKLASPSRTEPQDLLTAVLYGYFEHITYM